MKRTRRYERKMFGERMFIVDNKTTTDYKPVAQCGICDAYARPSNTKISIYNDWCAWFINHNGYCQVDTYNSNFFTLHGYFYGEDGKQYYARITHAHNYCNPVNE